MQGNVLEDGWNSGAWAGEHPGLGHWPVADGCCALSPRGLFRTAQCQSVLVKTAAGSKHSQRHKSTRAALSWYRGPLPGCGQRTGEH